MIYTDEQLKAVQSKELSILLKFDSICKKNGLKYQLFAGTLLGAVRHKGFIPWDDDIDVCMLRKDYDAFLQYATPSELGSDFFLQTYITDPDSVVQFAKLRLNNTIFEPDNEVSLSSHKGIYIDIFPLDNVMPDTREGLKQYKDFYRIYSIVTSTVLSRVKTSQTSWKKALRLFFYIITRIIPKRYFDNKLQKILRRFDNIDTEYVNHMTNGTGGNRMERFLMPRKTFEDVIEVEFEGLMFPAPRDYDAVLKRCYGDYMTLPPEAERVPHHGIVRLEY